MEGNDNEALHRMGIDVVLEHGGTTVISKNFGVLKRTAPHKKRKR